MIAVGLQSQCLASCFRLPKPECLGSTCFVCAHRDGAKQSMSVVLSFSCKIQAHDPVAW